MDEHDKQALETLRGLTLQVMLIAAGVFGVVGGFITSSEKAFSGVIWLMLALIGFAISGLFGYLVHGVIIGLLNQQKRFSASYFGIQIFTLFQILLFTALSLFFIVFIAINIDKAEAQEDIGAEVDAALESPYPQVLSEIFNDWDNKKISAKTEELRGAFEAALDRRVANPVYAFEKDPSYKDLMLSRFDTLGAAIEPELKLSIGARVVLLGSMIDKQEDLETYLGGQPDEFLNKLQMETFVTLGASQEEALAAGVQQIDARSVAAAYDEFRSVLYPFCCWRTYR